MELAAAESAPLRAASLGTSAAQANTDTLDEKQDKDTSMYHRSGSRKAGRDRTSYPYTLLEFRPPGPDHSAGFRNLLRCKY